MASLVVVEGPNRGAIHALRPDVTRLGRDATADVQVHDDRASRAHAEVRLDGARLLLDDLGSTNGTTLNGVPCGEAPLVPGDEVGIGDVRLLVVDDDDLDAGSGLGRTTASLPLTEATAPAPARRAQIPEAAPAIVGTSPAIAAVHRLIHKAAAVDATVLVLGESGTGKELVARAIHRGSRRRRGPFHAVNGAALRGSLLESELFGHEKGAFTGAVARRKGAFELAEGGTLFLDEVGELSLEAQASLLRVIEGHGFQRLGGGPTLRPDVRLVAATNRDLAARVKEGAFREDLLYRLDVLSLRVPPLRERPGDVRLLAEHFLRALAGGPRRFTADALAALEAWPFPGNVRELRNLVERLLIVADGEELGRDDLPAAMRAAMAPEAPAPTAGSSFPTLREVERAHVARALTETGWNKTRAAQLLGIDRVTLYAKIDRFGLAP